MLFIVAEWFGGMGLWWSFMQGVEGVYVYCKSVQVCFAANALHSISFKSHDVWCGMQCRCVTLMEEFECQSIHNKIRYVVRSM